MTSLDEATQRIVRDAQRGIMWEPMEVCGVPILALVGNAGTIVCHDCADPLSETLREGEYWHCTLKLREYRCAACFAEARPALQERLLTLEDRARVMPRLMKRVAREIEAHRRFRALPALVREEYDGAKYVKELACSKYMETEMNAYQKSLWRHLYHGEAMPQ